MPALHRPVATAAFLPFALYLTSDCAPPSSDAMSTDKDSSPVTSEGSAGDTSTAAESELTTSEVSAGESHSAAEEGDESSTPMSGIGLAVYFQQARGRFAPKFFRGPVEPHRQADSPGETQAALQQRSNGHLTVSVPVGGGVYHWSVSGDTLTEEYQALTPEVQYRRALLLPLDDDPYPELLIISESHQARRSDAWFYPGAAEGVDLTAASLLELPQSMSGPLASMHPYSQDRNILLGKTALLVVARALPLSPISQLELAPAFKGARRLLKLAEAESEGGLLLLDGSVTAGMVTLDEQGQASVKQAFPAPQACQAAFSSVVVDDFDGNGSADVLLNYVPEVHGQCGNRILSQLQLRSSNSWTPLEFTTTTQVPMRPLLLSAAARIELLSTPQFPPWWLGRSSWDGSSAALGDATELGNADDFPGVELTRSTSAELVDLNADGLDDLVVLVAARATPN